MVGQDRFGTVNTGYANKMSMRELFDKLRQCVNQDRAENPSGYFL